jgi:hypothetical protein
MLSREDSIQVLMPQGLSSGGTGIRTPDPLHAMQVLYQLSYTPKGLTMLPVDSWPAEFATELD